MWDWPFANDRGSRLEDLITVDLAGIAQGAYTKEKFIVCLPFNKGGTGEKNGTVSLVHQRSSLFASHETLSSTKNL